MLYNSIENLNRVKHPLQFFTFLFLFSQLYAAELSFIPRRIPTPYKNPRSTDMRDPIFRRCVQAKFTLPPDQSSPRYHEEFPSLFAANGSPKAKNDHLGGLEFEREKCEHLCTVYQNKVDDLNAYIERTTTELREARRQKDLLFANYHAKRLEMQNRDLQKNLLRLFCAQIKQAQVQNEMDELQRFFS